MFVYNVPHDPAAYSNTRSLTLCYAFSTVTEVAAYSAVHCIGIAQSGIKVRCLDYKRFIIDPYVMNRMYDGNCVNK